MVPVDGTKVRGFESNKDANLKAYNEYLKSINTVKIDASTRVPNGPEVDGMDDLKKFLLKERKEHVAENVLRRLLAYAIGRELNFRDRSEVEKILNQSKQTEYTMQDMIVEICQSNTFRGKTENKP